MWDHYPRIELPITIEQFHTLPRNAAYRYEYLGDRAVLTGRPKSYSCVRDTGVVTAPRSFGLEPLPAREIPGLEDLFLVACRQTQPFESLDAEHSRLCARDCLNRVVAGREGPVVEDACFQAFSPKDTGETVGAALVTLAHEDMLTKPFTGEWKDAPADAVARRLGCPHLTWVFVNQWAQRRGIGTALLVRVLRVLHEMGYQHLASTFSQDNVPSAMWHWRNGFRLLPNWSEFMRSERQRGLPQPP